jgi:hypothetical protein
MWHGALVRSGYRWRLERGYIAPVRADRVLASDYTALSGGAHLPEQVASLRSFIRRVGQPRRTLIISDGTHTESDRAILKRQFSHLEIVDWQEIAGDLSPALRRYAQSHPHGVKLAVMRRMPQDRTTVYADSDVLFLGGSAPLHTALEAGPVRYMRDADRVGGDMRLVDRWGGNEHSANAGFVIIRPHLDWDYGMHLLESLRGEPAWNTEQTICHLVLRRAGAVPLSDQHFVLTLEDKWMYSDHAAPLSNRAARHYVGPVRHKFWQALAKQLSDFRITQI